MKCIWKPLLDFEGLYVISNTGTLKRVPRSITTVNGVVRSIKEIYIKQSPTGSGYPKVTLTKNSKESTILVHRLVAKTFIVNKDILPSVNHKNGNKDDNRVCNLEWCSYSDNTKHAYKNGLLTSSKGSKHGLSKLKESDVIEMRKLLDNGASYEDMSIKYNVSKSNVGFINRKQTWKHV